MKRAFISWILVCLILSTIFPVLVPSVMGITPYLTLRITNKGNPSDYPTLVRWGDPIYIRVAWYQDFQSKHTTVIASPSGVIDWRDNLPPGSYTVVLKDTVSSLLKPQGGQVTVKVTVGATLSGSDTGLVDRYEWTLNVMPQPQTPREAWLWIFVKDAQTQAPIAGATVYFDDKPMPQTDHEGKSRCTYRVVNPPETHSWRVEKSGYKMKEGNVRIGDFESGGAFTVYLERGAQQGRPPELTLFTPEINGLTVTINGVARSGTLGTAITRIHWDWGDGFKVDGWFPASHTYARAETYRVTVTAHQSDGLSTAKSIRVTVRADSFKITKISRVYYDPLRRDIIEVSGSVTSDDNQFTIQLSLKNKREGFYDIKIYRWPYYFRQETLVYDRTIWPRQTLYPVKVQTPGTDKGSEICIDVELNLAIEVVRFVVDIILPVPVDPISYGEHYVWLKSELVSYMILNGYLSSDYESNPDAKEFLRKFVDLCSKDPKYVLARFSEFAKRCYITFEMDGLQKAIESFASKVALPYKLLKWEIHVSKTPAAEIIYVSIGRS